MDERGSRGPKSLEYVSVVVDCGCECGMPLRRVRLPPFIVQGVSIYMEGEGKSGGRANSDPSLSSVQCPMVAPLTYLD